MVQVGNKYGLDLLKTWLQLLGRLEEAKISSLQGSEEWFNTFDEYLAQRIKTACSMYYFGVSLFLLVSNDGERP